MVEWAVITLGRFSRNRYWGEDDGRAYRDAVCTSVLIRADGHNIVVDPALASPHMEAALDGCSGLKPAQIDIVYITHGHSDHFVGLGAFPSARCLCAPDEVGAVKASLPSALAARVCAAPEEIAPGVRLIKLPGHTLGLAGLIFESRDGTVAVAGDAVMTRDFFDDRRGYYNSADMPLSTASVNKLAETADIIVPGHGNYFPVV